jgi:NADH-quinone oxidoreductase subunit F
MWRILDRTAKGKATFNDIELLSDVTKQIEGHTICAFGEGSSWPVQGLLRHFRKEIDKRCSAEPMIKKKKDVPYLVDQHLLEKENA